MNTDQVRKVEKHSELTERIIGIFYGVYDELGSTQLEVALLMNFGPTARIKRFVMDNKMKKTNIPRIPEEAQTQSVSSGPIRVKSPLGGAE